jgi:hypothetical protein
MLSAFSRYHDNIGIHQEIVLEIIQNSMVSSCQNQRELTRQFSFLLFSWANSMRAFQTHAKNLSHLSDLQHKMIVKLAIFKDSGVFSREMTKRASDQFFGQCLRIEIVPPVICSNNA